MLTYIKIKVIEIIFFPSPVTIVGVEPTVCGEVFRAKETKVPLIIYNNWTNHEKPCHSVIRQRGSKQPTQLLK